MASTPSGLARRLASFATEIADAMPTEQVMPCSARTRERMRSAITSGGPNNRAAPRTSRKASSRDITSTTGVNPRKVSMIAFDTGRRTSKSGGTSTRRGQSRRASTPDMPERMP